MQESLQAKLSAVYGPFSDNVFKIYCEIDPLSKTIKSDYFTNVNKFLEELHNILYKKPYKYSLHELLPENYFFVTQVCVLNSFDVFERIEILNKKETKFCKLISNRISHELIHDYLTYLKQISNHKHYMHQSTYQSTVNVHPNHRPPAPMPQPMPMHYYFPLPPPPPPPTYQHQLFTTASTLTPTLSVPVFPLSTLTPRPRARPHPRPRPHLRPPLDGYKYSPLLAEPKQKTTSAVTDNTVPLNFFTVFDSDTAHSSHFTSYNNPPKEHNVPNLHPVPNHPPPPPPSPSPLN